MVSRLARPILPLVFVVGNACSGDDGGSRSDAGPDVVMRDSAGISIVESHAPVLGSNAWSVIPEPLLEIGLLDGEEPYVFTRIWDAARLPDGRLAVVDEMTMEVRLFDPSGRHLQTFGGGGDGPAEFGGPPFVEAVDDTTLIAWDGGHERLSWFRTDGMLLDQVTLQEPLAELGVFAFPNGLAWEIDAEGSLLSTGFSRPARSEGLRDSFRRIVLVRDRGDAVQDFGSMPAGQSFLVAFDRGRIGVGNPYAPATSAALAPGGGVAIGDSERWEVRRHGPDGSLRRILRAAIPRAPVTAELRDKGLEAARRMGETSPLTIGQAEDAYARIPLPDSVPAIASITAAGDELWVARRVGWWYETGSYDVFDAEGRWLTTVPVPDEIERVLEIGDDYLLAHVRDELEVSRVRMYRVTR